MNGLYKKYTPATIDKHYHVVAPDLEASKGMMVKLKTSSTGTGVVASVGVMVFTTAASIVVRQPHARTMKKLSMFMITEWRIPIN